MAKENILIVEDEEDLAELVRYNLSREGYLAHVAPTGTSALTLTRTKKPDLILLDLMLPELDGLEVCKRLKADPDYQHIPVVMLTAKGEEADIVTGLEMGADDYITKPFSPRVMLARVRAVLRRRPRQVDDDQETLRIHNLIIHPGRHEVLVDGKPLTLTNTEFRVLHYLARRPGWVFTRYQIVDAVHGEHYAVTDRSVDVQIVGLRKKLGVAGDHIETVRGVGYRFRE
ncbi:MAG: response regulator [Candidatus Hydrogenedentes bacterium]|nr:response regulator [Candidatus Hydrogenedentota bacterium]MBI3119473.1 response regulator [Candidatus Hydrogenedentota bacterium]